MKKLLLLAVTVFSPNAFANQLISIQPGSTITLSPGVLTTVTCSGASNGGTVNRFRCICEGNGASRGFGLVQVDAQTGAQLQRLTDHDYYDYRSQCISAMTTQYQELCN